jgi:hypothetical protein
MDLSGGTGFLGGSFGPFVGTLVQAAAFELRDIGSANELLLEGNYDAPQPLNWPAFMMVPAFGGNYTLTANSDLLQDGRIWPQGQLDVVFGNLRVDLPIPETPATSMCQLVDTAINDTTCFAGVTGLKDFHGQPNVDFTPFVPEPSLSALLGVGLVALLAARSRA